MRLDFCNDWMIRHCHHWLPAFCNRSQQEKMVWAEQTDPRGAETLPVVAKKEPSFLLKIHRESCKQKDDSLANVSDQKKNMEMCLTFSCPGIRCFRQDAF